MKNSMAPMADAANALPLAETYRQTRAQTLRLVAELHAEDTALQTMPDVSPSKWHLAHVTWFFERFVLQAHVPSYTRFDDSFHYLFNSYYYTAGAMHARGQRGQLSRPTLAQIRDYRVYVDTAMQQLLQTIDDKQADERERLRQLTTLGLNHEQQHQELILTDIKHVFSCNPLRPAVSENLTHAATVSHGRYDYTNGASGIQRIGAGGGFCFDNETPRHDALLQEHRIGNRLISNGEYREFIRDGGYDESELWLADGWATINERDWQRPLYWDASLQTEFTLGGDREIDDDAPVCHVSFYEADAFARWAGARLPTEFEWEMAAQEQPVAGNFVESNHWHPIASEGPQFFGDVWEWTSSAYAAYPGFKPLSGSLGEYNGKFMCNQMSVRGGSCVTARDHIRATYRSFFYPDARWQFLGIRLAKDRHEN